MVDDHMDLETGNMVDDRMDVKKQLLPSPLVDNDNGGSHTMNLIRAVVLVVNSVIRLSKDVDRSPEQPETNCIFENVEETAVSIIVDTDDETALLNSRKKIPTVLSEIFSSSLSFKAKTSTTTTAYVHQAATERITEASGLSEDLSTLSPEHHVTICQTTTSPEIIDQVSDDISVSPENHENTVSINHPSDDIRASPEEERRYISEIVRHKNLQNLEKIGGVSGAADALGTDLVKGLTHDEANLRISQQQVSFSVSFPTHTLFYLAWKEVKNKTILLVFMAAVLSIVFGINEEGIPSGLHDGVVVLIAIVLIVLFSSIRNYWQEKRGRNKLEKQQFREVMTSAVVVEVHVIREDECKSICESDLVCGDVVLLKKGSQIPADGLFVDVDGQPLELDYGSDPYMVNTGNPFLSYGERVINGDARMVVTATFLETGWSDMMRESMGGGSNRCFELETHLDKLNICMHYTRLVISILIILVLYLRYKFGKLDESDGYIPESMTKPTAMRTLANTFKNLIRESKYTTRLLTKFLSVSLVGVTEGVPFVVSLANVYWNDHEKLVGVAPKMALITRICTDTFGGFTENEMEVEMVIIGGKVTSACTTIPPNIVDALCDGIGSLDERAEKTPILDWAKDKLGFKSGSHNRNETVLHFSGPVNEVLKRCRRFYNLEGKKADISETITRSLDQANDEMQGKQMEGIAFYCAEKTQANDENELVLVAILGLKNKNKEDIKSGVKACRKRGIETVIISSKNEEVVKTIALQFGVITDVNSESSMIITGEVLRNCTNKERLEKVKTIRVVAEAQPSDKLLFVNTLTENGEVVAFFGQRTDESPALKAADIGIAIGTWSSIKARESCDIILRDGRFADVIMMFDSGKRIYLNVQKFLQLVLITTASSTLINFVETIVLGDASLTIIQLVWVNMAVTFLGGFALLTKPLDKSESLSRISRGTLFITKQMVRNILLQMLYEVTCSTIIQLRGFSFVGTEYTKPVVSNIFILCQFFNVFNARELQRKNFFRGIHQHLEFWVAISCFIVLHAVFVSVQDIIGYGTRLNWKLWVGCVLVSLMTWVVDWVGKCISIMVTCFMTWLRTPKLKQ